MSPIILNPSTTLNMTMQGIKLIEASAGTGKTFAIGNLYLRMILEGMSTEHILVVTFTNAATEELRGRIRSRIHAALSDLESGKDHGDELLKLWHSRADAEAVKLAKHRLKVAMTSMDAAAIYTIHAFCQKMLTEHAFYSGQAFDVEMLTDDGMLWEEALKDWWRNQIATMDEETFPYFQNAFHSLNDVMTLQKSLRQPSVQLMPQVKGHSSLLMTKLKEKKNHLLEIWLKEENDILDFFKSTACVRGKLAKKWSDFLVKKNLPSFCEGITQYLSEKSTSFPKSLEALSLKVLEPSLKSAESIKHLSFFENVDVFIESLELYKVGLLHEVDIDAQKKVAHVKQQSGQLAFDDQLVHLHRAVLESAELRDAIRERFPIAMIDEFQDTDAIQYGIFNRLYQGQKGLTLLMIGDPKQAIYSFRGGDIFTYMQAKKHADEHYTLDTNWRSTPAMIAAVNHLFDRHHQPFLYDAIPFSPVQVADKKHTSMSYQGVEVKALTLWQVPANGSKDTGNILLHDYVANEIATLLQQAEQGDLYLGDRAVQANDIAVLTRGHNESAAVRQALQMRGIGAVTAGKAHVFQSDEANGLHLLLNAVLEYEEQSMLREAITSSLLGYAYQDIHQQLATETTQFKWQNTFKTLHELWEKQGFMVMFQSLLHDLHIGEHLVAQNDGERRLTNLFQLAELLQQEAQSRVSMTSLLTWFEEQCQNKDDRSDEAQLRLENDEDLVQISTIHAAKGLEYPIVFVPYLWDCKPRKLEAKHLLPYYDEEKEQHYLELNAATDKLVLAEKERLAEDMRLLYVALTRASHKLYLAWGSVGRDASKSALAHLFYAYSQESSHNSNEPLSILTDLCDENIALQELGIDLPKMISLESNQKSVEKVQIHPFLRKLSQDWGISSFTRLSRHVHTQGAVFEKPDLIQDAVFKLPSNRNMGICLHGLLEHLDFQTDIPTQVDAFIQKHGVRYGIDNELVETLSTWMNDVVHTPLQDSLCLNDIAKSQRLNELHFDMVLPKLRVHQLNQTLQQATDTPLQDLMGADCRGYLTGEIDLVFEHDGRYYIADYKSNHLGYSLDDYQPEALQTTIFAHRYDLQYLIYTVALHRYLQLRIPDYDYEKHFGGVYYLFLRGMRAEHASNYGVFFHQPDVTLIKKLDDDIFGKGSKP